MNIGDKAPEILGINEKGEEIRLSNYAGKKIVLYFYPKDMTSGCTAQACNLRDNYAELKQGLRSNRRQHQRREVTPEIHRKEPASVHTDCRYGTQAGRDFRCMGRKKHVRTQIHGYLPYHFHH